MEYKLVQTKNGLVPINKIRKGTFVLCKDGWKPAPKPVISECVKCSFETLPTTTFEKSLVRETVRYSNEIILPKGESRYELSIRGYFNEDRQSLASSSLNVAMDYFLPRYIRYYNSPASISLDKDTRYIIRIKKKKFTELCGEQLSERNLEYYLEGFMRRTMTETNRFLYVTSYLCETDKLIMRLLKIDVRRLREGKVTIINYYEFLKHIKDSYNKKRLKSDDIKYWIDNRIILGKLSNSIAIKDKVECEDWCLPGINPLINTLMPD